MVKDMLSFPGLFPILRDVIVADRVLAEGYEHTLHGLCVAIGAVVGAYPGRRQVEGRYWVSGPCSEFGAEVTGLASEAFLITDIDVEFLGQGCDFFQGFPGQSEPRA